MHSFSVDKTDIITEEFAHLFRIDMDGSRVDIMQQISYSPLQNLYKGEYFYGTNANIYYVNNFYCIEINNIITFFRMSIRI